jgi:hypothetical protein
MREYTDSELISRVWDVEEIKKVINKRCVYLANEWREKELNDLWVSDPETAKSASFGRNTGWYVGMDAIRDYYVAKHDKAIGDGKGWLTNHPATTGLVRLAGDGKTARGLWYSIAQETRPNGDGTAKALWMPEKIAVDFVKEADGWKIWHLVIANDLTCEAGDDYGQGDPYVDWDTDPVAVEFGEPTVKKLIHDPTFNWWDDYPPIPEPYETFDPRESYGPEGYHEPDCYNLGAKEGRNYQ